MSTTGPGTAPFTAETFQNEYLATGVDTVDAVVTVAAAGDPGAGAARSGAGDRAEVIIFDTSGSMGAGRKMQAAKDAASAAVDSLDDGVAFAIIAGDHEAKLLWPQDGRSFAVADQDDRAGAKAAIAYAEPAGGTAIGTWLDLARQLFAATTASARHAILLTDGRNEHQQPHELAAAVSACRGLFQCDCRGVGVDWEVEEMRGIATALLGTVDIVADPADLAADFRAMIDSSQSRALPDVKLRLWAPQGAVIESLRQVAPEVLDLTATGTESGPLARDFLLGGWAPGESRDYHLRVKVNPGGVGDEMLAGRVSLVLTDGTVATQALVRAVWTDDTVKSTRMDRHVAHYTGQVELADAIHEGLAARKAGDEKTATVKLGRAVQLAAASGNGDTMRLLSEVVDVDDADSGTVRLRKDAGKAAEMTLDTRSTRTVRLGKKQPDDPSSRRAGGERRLMATTTCPAGHESTTADYCDTCGAPIGATTAPPEPAGEPAAPVPAPAPAAPEPAACPGCGESVTGRFCESCGYDIESGTPAAPPPVTLVLGTDRAHWERMVGEGEPAFPTVGPTLSLELTGDRAVLGRVRTGATVDVDLALTGTAADPAVSHNQCVFERDGQTWTVHDAGSANGTWINDATEPLAAGATHRLVDGDRILIGAWTSLTVQTGPSGTP